LFKIKYTYIPYQNYKNNANREKYICENKYISVYMIMLTHIIISYICFYYTLSL